MVRSCHSAKLWAPLVLADFSGCGAFQRGAQHLAGLSPELAVSCSRSEVPALVLFEEKTITEVGRSTQNVKWNKFQEYLRNRAGGGGRGVWRRQEWRKEANWLQSLMANVPQCSLLQSLPPFVHPFPIGSLPSGLRSCPTFCLPVSFNKKTLLLHFPLFLSSLSN